MKNLHEPGQLYSVAAGERKAKKRKRKPKHRSALESDKKVQETGKRREHSAPQPPGQENSRRNGQRSSGLFQKPRHRVLQIYQTHPE